MINRIWSILTQGKSFNTQGIGRKTSRYAYKRDADYESTLDLFVPYRDTLLQAKYAESCVHLILASSLRERALSFDPMNTYEDSTLLLPTPGFYNSSELTLTSITSQEAFTDRGEGIFSALCEISAPNTLSTKYGEVGFTVENNLSSAIEIQPGFSFRIQGTPDDINNMLDFTVEWVADPRIEFADILKTAGSRSFKWEDPDLRSIYLNDAKWVEKLAALLLSAVENSSG